MIEAYRTTMHIRAKDLVMVVNGAAKEVYPANKKLAAIHRFLRFLESRLNEDRYADDKRLVIAQRQKLADSTLPEKCANCKHARLIAGLQTMDGKNHGRCHIHNTNYPALCAEYHPNRPNQLDEK